MNADLHLITMAIHAQKGLLLAVFVGLLVATDTASQEATKSDLQHGCDAAQSQAEMNQCAGQEYKKEDTQLNTAYQKILKLMQSDRLDAEKRHDRDQINWTQRRIDKLIAAEKAWITYRDLHCEAAKHEYEGGSMSPMVWASCMAETTRDRIDELKSSYARDEQ